MRYRFWLLFGFILFMGVLFVPPKFVPDYFREQRRLDECERFLPSARTMTTHMIYARELPPEYHPKYHFTLYAFDGIAFGFEFSSDMPIDSNPIYFYVDESVPNPDEYADKLCREKCWGKYRKLSRPRWYQAWGA